MRSKKRKIYIISTAFIIVIAIFIAIHHQKNQPKSHWVKARSSDVYRTVYGLGTVTSDNVYNLRVGVTTSLRQLFVHEGEKVKSGSPLVSFTDLPLIRAPIGGTVTSIPIHKAETIYPQTTILTIMDLKKRYILVTLEQQGALLVQKGQVVKISIESIRNQNFTGTVENIYPKDNNFYVKIRVKDLPQKILPEMTTDVAIIVADRKNVLQVPTSSIHDSTVITRDGNKKIPIKVSLGESNGDWTEITSGNLTASTDVLASY
jgi:macrolide-specific efflux system membrane fusion protein